MEIKKEFGNLSDFSERNVELFKSSDQNATAIYFTSYDRNNRENVKAYFELLRFGSEGGNHQIYLKYPDTDIFVEIYKGRYESGQGTMLHAEGKNIWEKEHDKTINIYSHDDNLVLFIGKMNLLSKFNFMTKVASYNKGNPFNQPYPDKKFINYEEIEKVLSMKYLKIPDSIKTIEYCYKTDDEIPKYFIVDYPTYNFQYKNHRFFMIENNIVKEFKIKKFDRYKDGGTTIITVIDDNSIEHEFFSPTVFSKDLVEKWDNIELIKVTDEEKNKLVELLNI
jgi:hypothetical protein